MDTSSIIGIIITLIIMEGLLSFDNGMVLATMVNKLKDPVEQKKALYYGMVGAVGFRIIFIALGVFLINLWWLKVLGGAYLLKLAYDHFFKNSKIHFSIKSSVSLVSILQPSGQLLSQ